MYPYALTQEQVKEVMNQGVVEEGEGEFLILLPSQYIVVRIW